MLFLLQDNIGEQRSGSRREGERIYRADTDHRQPHSWRQRLAHLPRHTQCRQQRAQRQRAAQRAAHRYAYHARSPVAWHTVTTAACTATACSSPCGTQVCLSCTFTCRATHSDDNSVHSDSVHLSVQHTGMLIMHAHLSRHTQWRQQRTQRQRAARRAAHRYAYHARAARRAAHRYAYHARAARRAAHRYAYHARSPCSTQVCLSCTLTCRVTHSADSSVHSASVQPAVRHTGMLIMHAQLAVQHKGMLIMYARRAAHRYAYHARSARRAAHRYAYDLMYTCMFIIHYTQVCLSFNIRRYPYYFRLSIALHIDSSDKGIERGHSVLPHTCRMLIVHLFLRRDTQCRQHRAQRGMLIMHAYLPCYTHWSRTAQHAAHGASYKYTGAKLDNVQFPVIRINYNALLRITTHD